MKNFREELNKLEVEVSKEFDVLVKGCPLYDFVKDVVGDEDGLEDCDDINEFLYERDLYNLLPTVEMRNGITGNVFDVNILSVHSVGIYAVQMDDTSNGNTYKFSDIANTYDKIVLLEDMTNYYKPF